VLVSRGGASPTVWGGCTTTLGNPSADTCSGVFRFTCDGGTSTPSDPSDDGPCFVSLAAVVTGGGTAEVIPRILIHRQDLGGGPMVYCEYGDQASNSTPSQPALGPLTFGVGGSYDCGAPGQTGTPPDSIVALEVPPGYYDVWTTFSFVNYVPAP
jgi:hypothetical protein